MLIPSMLPIRPNIQTDPLSTVIMYDRSNKLWHQQVENPYFLYPIHISDAFMFTPTLTSALYLLLLRFLSRKYNEVCKLVEYCSNDSEISKEELLIYEQFPFLIDDMHPDAHACRLKLSLATTNGSIKCPWYVAHEFKYYLIKEDLISAECRLNINEQLLIIELCDTMSPIIANRELYLRSIINKSTDDIPIMINRIDIAIESNYDLIKDETYLQSDLKDSIMSTFQNISYNRPKDLSQSEIIEYLNTWIENGLRLRGGTDSLGFLFFYELLSNSLSLVITKTDKPYILASYLLRYLPIKDRKKSILMSPLRILANNPILCQDPELPKWQDKRKFKVSLIFAKQTAFQTFFNKLKQFLIKNKNDIKWPCDVWGGHEKLQQIEQLLLPFIPAADPNDIVLGRGWINPKKLIANCTKRQLIAGAVDSIDDLISFSTIPLNKSKLNEFINLKTRQERNLQQINQELLFDISSHKYAQTHVAQLMLNRLNKDMKYYAMHENQIKQVELKHFNLNSLHQLFLAKEEEQGSDHFKINQRKLSTQLKKIQNYLNNLKQKDSEYIQTMILNCLDLVNGIDKIKNIKNHAQLAYILRLYSGHETKIWFEYLITCFLNKNSDENLLLLNPFLDENAVLSLYDSIVSIMLHSIRLCQISTCLSLCTSLMDTILNVDNYQNLKLWIQQLSLQQTALANALTLQRHYITAERTTNDILKLYYDPRFLVFEFTQGILIRKSQVQLIDKFMRTVSNGKSMVNQMIMGAGKTTVVGPMLSLLLADGQKLVIQVVPKSLLEFSRSILRERFSAIIRKSVYTFSFDRFTEVNTNIYHKLNNARKKGTIVITTPKSLKSFF